MKEASAIRKVMAALAVASSFGRRSENFAVMNMSPLRSDRDTRGS